MKILKLCMMLIFGIVPLSVSADNVVITDNLDTDAVSQNIADIYVKTEVTDAVPYYSIPGLLDHN